MAEPTSEVASTTTTVAKRQRPSAALLIAGVWALLISVWALIGPVSWLGQGAVSLGPIVVVAAIVTGAVLVFGPRRGTGG